MITGELKNKIDSLWDIFAAGGLVNPLDVIEQITYLMFIHDLDDSDNLRAKEAAMLGLPYTSIFTDEVQVGERTIDGQQLKWSVFHDFPAGKMYSVVQEWVFPFIKNLHGDKNSAYSKYMDDAIFKLPTPPLLSKVVDSLDEIYRLMSQSQAVDVRGDTYEYLLSKISQSGLNGQFRTPRHIIRMMVELMDPKADDVICDPACGTSGFLVSAGEYLKEHRKEEIFFNRQKKDHYMNHMFFGYDMDRTMLRIGAMNMMTHGIDNPFIEYRDSLSDQNPDKEKYSLILANPPFKGSLDADTVSADLLKVCKTKKTELLFLALFLRMLRIGGRCACIGIFLVRTKEGATMKELLSSLGLGTNVSAGLIAVATFIILYLLGIENWLGLSFSVISGLVAGVVIGQATEYYTSHSYKPTQKIAEASQTGPATVIIKGIGTGMISTMIPVVTISVAIMLSYLCANGFDMSLSAKSISTGLYGIGIAAVGMLSTLGITLATDAYGPIADNAGGNAEMSGLGEEVRERTDALDALGNTTAATGKGFAIGSAALTALALLASYIEEIKIAMIRAMENGKQYVDAAGNLFDPTNATTIDFINFFQVNLINPKVLVGAFLGAMAAFLFCGLTMGAVGRAAESMVQEVRRQFREIKGILEGKATPDYGRCVEISTRSAQREMIVPSLLAIVIPIVVGLVLGVAGVLGLLTGGLAAGFTLAVFMSNSGGAWDNAKKMIEEGHFEGKGSDNHKATIVGDTVGDPFKDTSGPSLNILIKLMSMVSIVMAGLTIAIL